MTATTKGIGKTSFVKEYVHRKLELMDFVEGMDMVLYLLRQLTGCLMSSGLAKCYQRWRKNSSITIEKRNDSGCLQDDGHMPGVVRKE